MANSKIEIKIGIVKFSGEREPKWLSEQLDKILEKIPELLRIELSVPTVKPVSSLNQATKTVAMPPKGTTQNTNQPLSTFLKEKKPSSKPDIFLATSIWIHNCLEKN